MPCVRSADKDYLIHCALICLSLVASATTVDLSVDSIELPENFVFTLYTGVVPGARYLTVSRALRPPTSLAYVGSNTSQVYALLDTEGQGKPKTIKILDKLSQPNSVAWHNGSLFVAEVNSILQYESADSYVLAGKALPAPKVVLSPIAPLDTGPKVIGFGPDDRLYVTIGPPCSAGQCACGGKAIPGNDLVVYCSIAYLWPNGTDFRSEIKGIRNTGGFTFDPSSTPPFIAFTSQLQQGATTHRRGDDLLYYQFLYNLIDLGTPICYWVGSGDSLVRSVGPGNASADSNLTVTSLYNNPPATAAARTAYCQNAITSPSQALGPGVGASGVRFYRGAQPGYGSNKVAFPKKYVNFTAFVAEHGSLTEPTKPGFRVAAVRVTNGNGTSLSHVNFASGWLQDDVPWGRPVDVQPLLDGSLLISDDLAGAVYRVTYNQSAVPMDG